MAKNTICIWYDKDAEAAARFYAEVFPDSAVTAVRRAPGDYPSGKEGDVLVVEFTVSGIPCLGLNGGLPVMTYEISAADAAGPYVASIPEDYAHKAMLPHMSFTSTTEMLGEKFHMDEAYLRELNPGVDFTIPGTIIKVISPGANKTGKVARILADKARKQVLAYDDAGKLIPFDLPAHVLPLNSRPSATATSDAMGTCTTVKFDGAGSSDPEGDPLAYVWRFGDGQSAPGITTTHEYTEDGRFIATLEVTDNAAQFGNGSAATVDVFVKKPPVPLSDKRLLVAAGEDVRFVARSARFPEMTGEMISRALDRSRLLARMLAVAQLPRVDTRLLIAMWHLSERWGTVRPEGRVLPGFLSHELLGWIVGARRPSVTTALGELSRRGLVRRQDDGTWLLGDEPPVFEGLAVAR